MLPFEESIRPLGARGAETPEINADPDHGRGRKYAFVSYVGDQGLLPSPESSKSSRAPRSVQVPLGPILHSIALLSVFHLIRFFPSGVS